MGCGYLRGRRYNHMNGRPHPNRRKLKNVACGALGWNHLYAPFGIYIC